MFPNPRLVADDVGAAYALILITGGRVSPDDVPHLNFRGADRTFVEKYETALKSVLDRREMGNNAGYSLARGPTSSTFFTPEFVKNLVDYYSGRIEKKSQSDVYQIDQGKLVKTVDTQPKKGMSQRPIGTIISGQTETPRVEMKNTALGIFACIPLNLNYSYLHPMVRADGELGPKELQFIERIHKNEELAKNFVTSLLAQ